jgi:protein-S-isoprenylcysteine O-methyltransferase Ste14
MIVLAPRTLPSLPAWSRHWQLTGCIGGGLLMVCGTLLALAGVFNLGRNLTPFICPKGAAVLLEQGAYRFVRHPIYSGILQLAIGWALFVNGWLTLLYTAILFMVFDRKLRREEELLRRTFPGYTAYAGRVRRLIPFIY